MNNVLNKSTKILLIVFLLTISITHIYATDSETKKGVVNSSNGVNFRAGAGTTYDIVGGTGYGKLVTILGLEKTNDNSTSCSEWYKIEYNNSNAYVCKTYIDVVEVVVNPDYNYLEELKKFPDDYKKYIEKLHGIYPNAMFFAITATNTNGSKINFNDAVLNENVLGKSLIWDSNNSRNGLKSLDSYIFENKGFNNNYPGGGSTWYAANYDTIAYYMDPRNFLNEQRIFMFESQAYNKSLHTIPGVEAILKGSYMSNAYVDNTTTTFSSAIMDGAIYSGVSPYFLASRIRQEVGSGRSALVKGTYPDYPEFNGYYNYYNIGASGDNIVYNGLKKAYESGWDSEYKAIVYGSTWVGKNYVSSGQDTGYLQKWDVVCGKSSSCFAHQYMQNIEAPYSEALSTYNAYKNANGASMYLNSYVFNIPVYANMPASTSLPDSKDPINYLSSITINGELLNNFNYKTTDYTVTISSKNVLIDASLASSKSSLTGVGSFKINDGDTKVITVKSESGKTLNYNIKFKVVENGIKMTLEETLKNIKSGRWTDGYLYGLTSVDTLKNAVLEANEEAIVTVSDSKGNIITDGNLATNYKVSIKVLDSTKEYTVVILGDTNGDGSITILDLLRIQKQLLNSITLSDSEFKASDVNKDGSITILDLLLVQKHLLGSKEIVQ